MAFLDATKQESFRNYRKTSDNRVFKVQENKVDKGVVEACYVSIVDGKKGSQESMGYASIVRFPLSSLNRTKFAREKAKAYASVIEACDHMERTGYWPNEEMK